MANKDVSIEYNGLNRTVWLISSVTENAIPNTDFEVHTHHQDFEIYHFLEGDLLFAFEGKHIKVEEGTMIIIPNGILHRPIIKSNCRYVRKRILFNKEIFINFNTIDLDLYNKLRKRKILLLSKETVEMAGINTLFNDIENYLEHNSSYNDFCALICLFSLLIKAEKHSEKVQNIITNTHGEKISQIIQYIDEHLADDLSYKTLSKVFYKSEKSLYKLFKTETGFALGNYINERRIIKAQSILNAGGSAKTAAYIAGFKDYSVFYRCFLKKVGITPTEYIKTDKFLNHVNQ